jgi:hypothetical protein
MFVRAGFLALPSEFNGQLAVGGNILLFAQGNRPL